MFMVVALIHGSELYIENPVQSNISVFIIVSKITWISVIKQRNWDAFH